MMAKTAGGAGWSGKALSYGAENADWLEQQRGPVAYRPDLDISVEDKSGTSENHEGELLGVGAMNAALRVTRSTSGGQMQWQAHRTALLDFYLPRELATGPNGIGIGGHEGIPPDAHTHQHEAGLMAARVAAVLMGDDRLLDLTAELACRWAGYLAAVSSPRGYVAAAAFARAHDAQPVWGAATALWRQWTGQLPPLPEFAKQPANYEEPYYLPVRLLRWLQGAGKDAAVAAMGKSQPAGCRLKYEMRVYRWPGGHLCVIPQPANFKNKRDEVADWVLAPHNAKSFRQFSAQCQYGKGWQKKPPAVPKGAVEIVFPGR